MCLIIILTGQIVPWMGMQMFQTRAAPLEESGPARADTETNEHKLYENERTITHGCRDRSGVGHFHGAGLFGKRGWLRQGNRSHW